MFFKSSVLGDVAPDAHMVDEVGKSESTISIGSLNVRFNMELKQRGNVFAVMSSTWGPIFASQRGMVHTWVAQKTLKLKF